MEDIFNLSKQNEFGLKAEPTNNNSRIMLMNSNVENRQNDDPLLKTFYPIYLYKPPFGYPRNVNVIFLRELAKNPYVFSVIKAITDQAAESEWEIKPKQGVKVTEELQKDIDFNTQFFKNPNSDNEGFSQLLRKVIPDVLTLDSGCFVKVYNKKEELVQLRVIDGGAILKNPDRHGSMATRADIVLDDGYFGMEAGNGFDTQKKAYKVAVDQYNAYGYTDEAAYFQFAYGVNYSVPIPYGRKEIIYMMENPSSETVYSRTSALQSAIDITLNLIYSSKASLDLFLNANIPTGIIQIAGAAQEDTQAFQDSLYHQQYSGVDEYGFQRKVNGKLPVVGNTNVSFVPLNFKNNETQLLEIQQWFTKVLWSCFGVTADEMGFTENSNKSVGESQTKANARKAVRPRLSMIANYLNDQVMSELPGGDLLEFKFKEYDIDEDLKKHQLYEVQIRNGMLSPQMAAEKEGIDVVRLNKDKKENLSLSMPQEKPEEKKELKSLSRTAELKAELRMVYTSSRNLGHIHTGTDGEDRSSYDDIHDHEIDWDNGILLQGGEDNHQHRLMDFDVKIEPPVETKEDGTIEKVAQTGKKEYEDSEEKAIGESTELKAKDEMPDNLNLEDIVEDLTKELNDKIDDLTE